MNSELALSPLGERVARRPDALHREAGRVRGSGACKVPIKSLFVFRTCFLDKLDGLSGRE